MSITAALVTYKRKHESQLSQQDVDALYTIIDLRDVTFRKSNFKAMYLQLIEILKFWQEMEEFYHT